MAIQKYKKPKVYTKQDKPNNQYKRYGEVYGYNENLLRAYLTMAGYKDPVQAVMRFCDLTRDTAKRALEKGYFTRYELTLIMEKGRLNAEQMAECFFTEKGADWVDMG